MIDLVEWNGTIWLPFKSDNVQVEFVMLNPYVRMSLRHDNQGHYSTQFRIPDHVGVYHFKGVFICQCISM